MEGPFLLFERKGTMTCPVSCGGQVIVILLLAGPDRMNAMESAVNSDSRNQNEAALGPHLGLTSSRSDDRTQTIG
jgi:hypothetical protein